MSLIEIKTFQKEENIKEQISSLMNLCLLEEYGDSVKVTNVDNLINFYHSRQDSIIYYLEEDSEFKGFIWVIESSDILTSKVFCFFLYLGIKIDSRDKGFGKKLFSHAIDQSKAKGIKEIKLTVRVDNPKAISIYKSLGFNENKCEMIWKDPDN